MYPAGYKALIMNMTGHTSMSGRVSVKKFSISLPLRMFSSMEKARGLIPRSRFIAKILEGTLKEAK